jgi:hypothetical protein
MSVTTDIVQSWTKPGRVMQRHMARGQSEPFAFSLLITFLILVFISLWPGMARASLLQPEVQMTQRLVAAGLGLLAFIVPCYVLASLTGLVSKWRGWGISAYHARLALFASLLGIVPVILLQGLTAGMIGQSAALTSIHVIAGLGFVYMWTAMLRTAAQGGQP